MIEWWRRWRKAEAASAPDSAPLRSWAEERGWQFKPTRTHDGFVVEPPGQPPAWRLEWGPSHRAYLGRHELRLRAPLPLEPDAHAVVLPRTLQAALENELYSAFTDQVRTRLDESLPEEVRWLAVSPRLGTSELGPLREVLGAAGNLGPWLQAWLAGPTGTALATLMAPTEQGTELVLMTLNLSVLSLRAGVEQPTPARLTELVAIFERAHAEALRCLAELGQAARQAEDPPSSSLPSE
jgi:hypothetical protein